MGVEEVSELGRQNECFLFEQKIGSGKWNEICIKKGGE